MAFVAAVEVRPPQYHSQLSAERFGIQRPCLLAAPSESLSSRNPARFFSS